MNPQTTTPQKRPAHWYYVEHWVCTLCEAHHQFRARRFTKRPERAARRATWHYHVCSSCRNAALLGNL